MDVSIEQVRNYRLRNHHLDRKRSLSELVEIAQACGLQNSPPGAWETAAFNRLSDCSLEDLEVALYQKKILLQAWSYRGTPVIFPTAESSVFLTALMAQPDEQPWIYTRGISGALDYLGMSFEDVFTRLKKAIVYLDNQTIESKSELDRVLAKMILPDLPKAKQVRWVASSMYGDPKKQTVGEAAVSFLLRPCAFSSLVVFGERCNTPTFTSFKNWTGKQPTFDMDAEKKLVRKFLRCYGPSNATHFKSWLGCSTKQVRRLWKTIEEELYPVKLEGKTAYILEADKDALIKATGDADRLLLLGAHDPYLDLRDRQIILANPQLHKQVWKTVANPGVILQGGRVRGIWKSKKVKNSLEVVCTTWKAATVGEKKVLVELSEEYADFRQLKLKKSIFIQQ